MLDSLYNNKLLELAGNVGRIGTLAEADASATAHSKLCGSTVTVHIKMGDDGLVADYAQEVRACALGQASSAVMAANVIGASPAEIRAGRDAARAMLKEGAAPPEGRFSDMKYLEPVREYKARHASTLLAFDATVAALEKLEDKAARAGTVAHG